MKRFWLTFLLIVSLAPANAQKGHVIGFYNLENLFDIYDDPAKNDEEFLPEGKNKWTEAKYLKKQHNMATVIRAMHEDNGAPHAILGISEVENRLVIEDLVSQSEIASANYQIVHYDGPDRRGVDVALLYDPRQFKFIESQSIPVSFRETDVEISLSQDEQDYFRTRNILMARGTMEGEMFAVYVVHSPSRLGGKGGDLRSLVCEITYKHAAYMAHKYPGIKIVVMGDMNDNPQDDSQAIWLRGRRTIAEMTPEDFFDPFWTMLEDGYGSLAYHGEWNIYDIIQVNYNLAQAPQGGLKIRKITKNKYYGRIFHKPFMTQQSGQYKGTPFRTFSNGAFIGGYSDHYPTYIVVSK